MKKIKHPKRGNKSILAHLAPYEMPKPSGKYGYTGRQIDNICRKLSIDIATFWNAFGVNTVAVDNKGDRNYYRCDIERTLFNVTKGKEGKYHEWD